jgi:hypothetical protein
MWQLLFIVLVVMVGGYCFWRAYRVQTGATGRGAARRVAYGRMRLWIMAGSALMAVALIGSFGAVQSR